MHETSPNSSPLRCNDKKPRTVAITDLNCSSSQRSTPISTLSIEQFLESQEEKKEWVSRVKSKPDSNKQMKDNIKEVYAQTVALQISLYQLPFTWR